MILHHTIEGPGSSTGAGARVLLLHPVGIDLSFLSPLAALLATRYRVMRMDLRGHGASAALPLAQSLDDFADDVHDTLAHTGFAPCTVTGFSFGGMVAQTLALRHPADVAALIPCACPCTLTAERRALSRARGDDAGRSGMGVVIDATMERWFTPAFRNSHLAQAARSHLLERDVRGWTQGWRAMADIDLLPRLPALRVPTLCIAGELDISSTPENVAQIASAIPGAQYQVIPGAPHMLFIEQPAAVAHAISSFVDAR